MTTPQINYMNIGLRTGVEVVSTGDGFALARDVEIETRDWIRPVLLGGRAVFTVRREAGEWVPCERHSKDDG
jgi:hypothetical protein